jgi:nicotinate dehydrogenase subunit B
MGADGDRRAVTDPGGLPDEDDAPERYELLRPSLHRFARAWVRQGLPRRAFFKVVGGGFVVVSALTGAAQAQESGGGGPGRGRASNGRTSQELGAWLHIAADGAITVYTGKVEVGQDVRTSLTQAVLDELPARVESVHLVMGDTAETPFDAGTFGSRSTPAMAPQLRRVAATARQLLAARAAALWKVDAASVVVAEGRVSHPPSKRTATFGALTKGQRLIEVVPEDAPIRPPAQWTVAGKSLPKIDGRAVVTGARQYTSDVTRPGMLIGKVLRPPRLGVELETLDGAAAGAIAGVRVVRDGAFAGVVAPDAAAADQALAALRAKWRPAAGAPGKDVDGAGLVASFRATARESGGGGRGDRDRGDVEEGLGLGVHRLGASYEVAYIAHAPLEPRAAMAEWAGNKLTVWTGTQRPFGVRRELAEAFGLTEEAVRVICPDTGSGYGGKHTGDAALEAARLARAAGRPVRVVWTREEEFTWAYFRPAGVIDIRSAVDASGKLTAWEATNYNSGASGLRTPYEVPHQRHRFLTCQSPLRQGSYRGLAATANCFARESHMDELAALVKQDPLAFRERNLTDARLLAVLRAAAGRFRWGGSKPGAGQGHGLACGLEKGGYVACCVDLRAQASGQVEVTRVVTAFECGAVVNPDHLVNQIEGAVIMGLGGALYEAIDFGEGRIRNAQFSGYRVPRMGDLPKLETVLVDRRDLPSAGAGETPIMAIAPAIANALQVATGRRVRSLPMRRSPARG